MARSILLDTDILVDFFRGYGKVVAFVNTHSACIILSSIVVAESDYAKSHGVSLADAILVATTEAENAELKTLNTKHYPMLRGLRPAISRRISPTS